MINLKFRIIKYKILAILIFIIPILAILFFITGIEGLIYLIKLLTIAIGVGIWLTVVMHLLFK